VNKYDGEIILNSVDKEGTFKGFDDDLIRAVTDAVSIPVIASGGMGKLEDINTAVIKKDNVTGLQFHPEKSGEAGLKVLKKFISL